MSSIEYCPSEWVIEKFCQTEVTYPGYEFSVRGDYVCDLEGFVIEYIEKRKIEANNDGREWSEESDRGLKNLRMVLASGDAEVKLYHYEKEIKVNAKVMCCGEWLELYRFTNTCYKCGSDYNTAGNLLVPRHFWGEETGEHWSECY